MLKKIKKMFFVNIFLLPLMLHAQISDSLLFENNYLKIFKTKALYNQEVLYDIEEEYVNLYKQEGECAKGISYFYNPLSLVGEYYSYERVEIDYGGTDTCSRSPGSTKEIICINVRTKDTVSVLKLVEEQSMVAGLKADSWVRSLKNINLRMLDACNSLSEILLLINKYGSDGYSDKFKESSFAIMNYDSKTGNMALRLVGKQYNGFNHYSYIQLGLNVKPLKEIRDRLLNGKAFFLGKFKNGLIGN